MASQWAELLDDLWQDCTLFKLKLAKPADLLQYVPNLI
jgi:hypothetical protein